jgi:hypothetical protein
VIGLWITANSLVLMTAGAWALFHPRAVRPGAPAALRWAFGLTLLVALFLNVLLDTLAVVTQGLFPPLPPRLAPLFLLIVAPLALFVLFGVGPAVRSGFGRLRWCPPPPGNKRTGGRFRGRVGGGRVVERHAARAAGCEPGDRARRRRGRRSRSHRVRARKRAAATLVCWALARSRRLDLSRRLRQTLRALAHVPCPLGRGRHRVLDLRGAALGLVAGALALCLTPLGVLRPLQTAWLAERMENSNALGEWGGRFLWLARAMSDEPEKPKGVRRPARALCPARKPSLASR